MMEDNEIMNQAEQRNISKCDKREKNNIIFIKQ